MRAQRPGRSEVKTNTILCDTHVIPALGARKLRDLSAYDVDKWLAAKSKVLSTRSLEAVRSCLNRAVKRAKARDEVKRVRREFRKVLAGAAQIPGIEIDPHEWTTRETRTSFDSILSDRGIPLEEISRLLGHSSTAVTEEV
ncbi:hypothetical protein GCM10010388_45100 [Streptomyces mauvecolor]